MNPYLQQILHDITTRLAVLEETLSKHIPDDTKMVSGVKDSLTTQQEQDVDWKDMYEKEKRRSAMWIAKYEKDIEPLEYAFPAKQEQCEPVAVLFQDGSIVKMEDLEFVPEKSGQRVQMLYTTPQRKPLTGQKIIDIADTFDWDKDCAVRFARAIEAAHGIKE